jgi:hypothetical protein
MPRPVVRNSLEPFGARARQTESYGARRPVAS